MKLSLKRLVNRRKEGTKNGKKIWKILLVIAVICMVPVVVVGIAATAYVMSIMKDLPPVDRLENPFAMSTIIYDRNGNELYKIHGEENRKVIALEDMSEYVKQATIAIEDKQFWTRPFLDFQRIIGAAVNNYIRRSDQLQGASTITQQLIKNVFLTNERTYERKMKEAVLAYQVEKAYTREEILAFYLNQIPYGSNAYGVEQASMTFFDKTAKELTLAESAILASLPNAPTYFSPFGQRRHELMGYCRVDGSGPVDTATTSVVEATQSIELLDENIDVNKLQVRIVAANDVWMSITVDGAREQLTLPAGQEKTVTGTESVAINLGNTSPNIYLNTLAVKIPQNLSFTITRDTVKNVLENPEDWDALLTFQEQRGQKTPEITGECTGLSDPNWARGRKDLVLLRMVEDEYITMEQAEQAWGEALSIEFHTYRQAITHPHFVFYVKSYLEQQYGQEIETAGWRVYTTIDPKLQENAQKVVNEYGARNETNFKANQTALISIEPSTGQIMAMVGSRDYWDESRDGNVNITTRRLQPGSSFKSFIYAAMFEKEYGTGSVLWDVRTGFGPLFPNNYDGTFQGPMTVRRALALSRNIPAVKAYFLAGEEDEVLEFLDRIGVSSLVRAKQQMNEGKPAEEHFHYGWPVSLGTGEVTPLEMVSGYGVFANNGLRIDPTPILEIRDSEGNIIEQWQAPQGLEPVIDPQVAYQITDILADEAERPAGMWRNNLSVPGHPTASKTGTSNKRYPNGTILPNNLWTVGYTRHLATAVWVGHTKGDALSGGATGVGAATPVFHEYMKLAHEGKEVLAFDRPEGLREVTISTLSGLLASANTPGGYASTQLFSSWGAPVKVDDSFRSIQIDKRNGFLANALCPADVVQEAVQFKVQSEMPDRPSWENPVQEWARANLGRLMSGEEGGDGRFVVFDKESPLCREYSEADLPQVSIVSPQPFGTVARGKVNVKVNITAPFGIQKVEYFINDMYQYDTTEQPYDIGFVNVQHRFDADVEHVISVRVLDKNYNSATASATVRIAADNSPPTVSFTSPGSGEQFPLGSTVQVGIDAYDEQSNVSEVVLSMDGEVLRTFKQVPYSYGLRLDPNTYGPGTYTLTAVAKDDHGNSATASRSITLVPGVAATTPAPALGGSFQGSVMVNPSHSVGAPLRVGVEVGGGSGEEYTVTLMRQEAGKKAETVDSFRASNQSAGSYVLYWTNPTAGTHELFLMIQGGGDVVYSSRGSVTVE